MTSSASSLNAATQENSVAYRPATCLTAPSLIPLLPNRLLPSARSAIFLRLSTWPSISFRKTGHMASFCRSRYEDRGIVPRASHVSNSRSFSRIIHNKGTAGGGAKSMTSKKVATYSKAESRTSCHILSQSFISIPDGAVSMSLAFKGRLAGELVRLCDSGASSTTDWCLEIVGRLPSPLVCGKARPKNRTMKVNSAEALSSKTRDNERNRASIGAR